LLCRQEYDLTLYLLDSSGALKAVHFFVRATAVLQWMEMLSVGGDDVGEREKEREREMGSGVCLPHVSQECR
jgi:hypothetical protein